MPLLPAVFVLPPHVVFAQPVVPIVFVVSLAPIPFSVAQKYDVVFVLPVVPILFVVPLAPNPFSVAQKYSHYEGSVAFLPALPFVAVSELLVNPVHQIQLDADWPGSKLSPTLQLAWIPPAAAVLIFHQPAVVILFHDKRLVVGQLQF